MARTTKLTPEIQKKIVEAILGGNYFEVACVYAGVPKATAYEWIARGEGTDPDRPPNELYAQFADAVRHAEARAEIYAVTIIRQGFPDNPRLALDYLARRHADRWGPKDTLAIYQKLAKETEAMTDEELAAFVAERNRREGQGTLPDERGPEEGNPEGQGG